MANAAPSAEHQVYLSQQTFGALDGLRCLCIVGVVWHHCGPDTTGWPLASRGFLGVDLFFVISGFLIVTLLLRERKRDGAISLRNFYIRRTLRIFPAYYAIIFALAGFYTWINTGSQIGQQFVQDLPIYLTYTGNFFHPGWAIVWSLAAEEQFYLVWPQVERYVSKFVVPILVVAIAINQLFNFPLTRERIAEWLGSPGITTLSIVEVTFTPILLGVCLAHLLNHGPSFERIKFLLLGRFAAAGWSLALFALLMTPNDDISGLHRLAIHITMTGLLASCVIREDHLLMPFLRLKPLVRIGVISYGVYLFHIHAIVGVERILGRMDVDSFGVTFLASLALTIVIAELSYRFFEMPFLRLKRRFSHAEKEHL